MNTATAVNFYPVHQLRDLMPGLVQGRKYVNKARWDRFKAQVQPKSKAFLLCKFFEIFCRIEDYQIPLKRRSDGSHEFALEASVKDLDPEKIKINPAKVSITLLKHLGIDYKVQAVKGFGSKTKNQVVVDKELVKNLIRFFDCIEPLTFSLANVPSDKALNTPRYWQVGRNSKDLFSTLTGAVVRFLTQHKVEKNPYTEAVGTRTSRSLAIYASIASCIRGRIQERNSSYKDIDKLTPILAESKTLQISFWETPTVSMEGKEIRAKTTEELVEAVEAAMKSPVLEDKKAAKKQILSANPEAPAPNTAMKIGGAATRLEKTVDHIARRAARNEEDYGTLHLMYLKAKQLFDGALLKTENAKLDKGPASGYVFFGQRSISAEDRIKFLDSFLTRLGCSPEILKTFRFNSFRTFAEAILTWRHRAIATIHSGDFRNADQQINNLNQIIKIASKVHPIFLKARHAMIQEGTDCLSEGRKYLLDYLKELKECYSSMQDRNPRKQAFLKYLDRVEAAIMNWNLPAQQAYLKELKALLQSSRSLSSKQRLSDHIKVCEKLLSSWSNPQKQLSYLKELSCRVDIEGRF